MCAASSGFAREMRKRAAPIPRPAEGANRRGGRARSGVDVGARLLGALPARLRRFALEDLEQAQLRTDRQRLAPRSWRVSPSSQWCSAGVRKLSAIVRRAVSGGAGDPLGAGIADRAECAQARRPALRASVLGAGAGIGPNLADSSLRCAPKRLAERPERAAEAVPALATSPFPPRTRDVVARRSGMPLWHDATPLRARIRLPVRGGTQMHQVQNGLHLMYAVRMARWKRKRASGSAPATTTLRSPKTSASSKDRRSPRLSRRHRRRSSS